MSRFSGLTAPPPVPDERADVLAVRAQRKPDHGTALALLAPRPADVHELTDEAGVDESACGLELVGGKRRRSRVADAHDASSTGRPTSSHIQTWVAWSRSTRANEADASAAISPGSRRLPR